MRRSWREIVPQCETIIAVDINSPRALSKEALCMAAQRYCSDCVPAEDYRTALRLAREAAGGEGAVVICGSLYLAAEIRNLALDN